jgi:hypothetical protein
MELLFPFVDSALPLAYGVLGILLFHVSKSGFLQKKKKSSITISTLDNPRNLEWSVMSPCVE